MNYPESYGAWAGNPKGKKPDFTRCCAEVSSPLGNGWTNSHQCNRKRGHGPNGDYCKQHDPAAQAQRDAKAHARQEAEHRVWRMRAYGKTFYDALRQIAEGHNDARGLAEEVLAKFDGITPPAPEVQR